MSDAEATFAYWLHILGATLPTPQREYRFDARRKWRFDFAWVHERLAVEIEGGAYTGGRHARGGGFERDAEKYNAATLAGWRVLRFTPQMLKRNPQAVIDQVGAALGAARACE